MHTEVDYFSNHRVKLRYPWRLYHAPIVTALQRVIARSTGPTVLNLGSGPFLELEQLKTYARRFTVCDIDPRAIALARERYGSRLVRADVLEPEKPLPYASDTFDLVVSMDVIEHVPEPLPWLREALRVLKPRGLLFLTTPNYGSRSLRVLEGTALEAIARVQGFSRKQLHPSKMNAERLSSLLREAGVKRPRLERIAFSWVLAAYAGKSKQGLGTAYLAGFRWGLARQYQRFFEMDADFSHDPAQLARLFAALDEGAEVAVGSRNVPGGKISGWGAGRLLLSKGGSAYSRVVLGIAVRDLTTGYKAFTRRALETIQLEAVRSNGYAFQIELTFRALSAGLRVVEVPITFVDRRVGESKMDQRIFLEAMGVVWRLRLDALRNKL